MNITSLLATALAARAHDFDPRHLSALRLFNGFYEGCPEIIADLYGQTLLLQNYADPPTLAAEKIAFSVEFYRAQLPWLQAILLKERFATDDVAKRGKLIWGSAPNRYILENGVWYAVDLQLNQDASLYLDTRHLREWAKANLTGKTVLNTFAYTGSLGVAAKAGGASRVVQMDLNRLFLKVAKDSYAKNGFEINRADFLAGDFWPLISRFKQQGARFDCVIVDPPLFSRTRYGTVDLVTANQQVVNKVRPLIADGGFLVTINNALFVSGEQYLGMLQEMCADGYLTLETLVPVPESFLGGPNRDLSALPADPMPFNHPTKIAVLRVRRKDAASKPL